MSTPTPTEHPNGLKETPAAVDRFTSLAPATTQRAASYLMSGFAWSESREGLEYWSAIHKRLLEIARDGKTEPREGKAPHA